MSEKIAKAEGFDEEHQEGKNIKKHGPVGAEFVRPFLETLGYSGMISTVLVPIRPLLILKKTICLKWNIRKD